MPLLQLQLAVTSSDIIHAWRPEFAQCKRLKRFFFVEKLPRNPMKQVQKTALRQDWGGISKRYFPLDSLSLFVRGTEALAGTESLVSGTHRRADFGGISAL